MPDMLISEAHVLSAAKQLGVLNKNIQNDFSSVLLAVSRLEQSWKGSAADHAINSFYDIKKDYYEARFQSLNNYVCYLNDGVSSGYARTESDNTSLAQQFK